MGGLDAVTRLVTRRMVELAVIAHYHVIGFTPVPAGLTGLLSEHGP